MGILQEALEQPAQNNIFTQSVNPISTGCLLYKNVHDICVRFDFSDYTAKQIKSEILDQMVQILTIYKKPSDMIPIIEHLDIEGRDCIWYFNEYQMYQIFETKIMNQYIVERWNGPANINSDVMDNSTSYCILYQKLHNPIEDENFFGSIFKKMFRFDRSRKTHFLKFENWRFSMRLRYRMELFFGITLIIFFQYYITELNTELHASQNLLKQMMASGTVRQRYNIEQATYVEITRTMENS